MFLNTNINVYGQSVLKQIYLQKVSPKIIFKSKQHFIFLEMPLIKVIILYCSSNKLLSHKTWYLGSEGLNKIISQRFYSKIISKTKSIFLFD